jgi:glutamate synthase domain-containing protein 3
MPVVERSVATFCCVAQNHELEDVLDYKLIDSAYSVLSGDSKVPVNIEMPINNGNRAVGAMLSGKLAKKFGEEGLPEGTINIKLKGSAGQSLGAFLAKGISIEIEGDANDYLGKGICGGKIVLYPNKKSNFISEKNVIAGNVIFYGATDGKGFIRGIVGERFCVRNSGAQAVVEGIGDHGCEYMTGGRVVILGKTGRNFAAGMSGGIAYVYDDDGEFQSRCNMGMIELSPVNEKEDIETLRYLIHEHITLTGSTLGKEIVDQWEEKLKNFIRVLPIAYKSILKEERKYAQGCGVV